MPPPDSHSHFQPSHIKLGNRGAQLITKTQARNAKPLQPVPPPPYRRPSAPSHRRPRQIKTATLAGMGAHRAKGTDVGEPLWNVPKMFSLVVFNKSAIGSRRWGGVWMLREGGREWRYVKYAVGCNKMVVVTLLTLVFDLVFK